LGLMRGSRRNAALLGLAAVLIILGMVASFSLPPTFLLGSASQPRTTTVIPEGRLDVTVVLQNGSGIFSPMAGEQVGIAQLGTLGYRLQLTTDRVGNVSIKASPGAYGISIVDPRFGFSKSAMVSAGKVTRVNVVVNRTALPTEFAQAQDSTGQEQLGPWNELVVEVSQGGLFYFGGLLNFGGGSYVVGSSANNTLPKFGTEVFLQPMKLSEAFTTLPAFTPEGPEVEAIVVSQVPASQATWLTLRPMGIVAMTGSYYLSVITYVAGSSVRVSNV
jgi:hypothetical protein